MTPAVGHLTQRWPQVDAATLVRQFTVPPRFASVSFDTYLPDPAQPTQADAVTRLRAFASVLTRRTRRRLFGRNATDGPRPGVYLDGGFGVGKTHLLASLYREAPEPKAFGTFVEYTHLVGALGFGTAVDVLAQMSLVCIDEFELDDPGDTVLMSTLLGRLVDAGVRLAATSNTLPDRLGEGRFAAEDFLREIQGLRAHFDVVRIDGEDYRHRGLPQPPEPLTLDEVESRVAATPGATIDHFHDLQRHLTQVHPSNYGALVDGVSLVGLTHLRPLADQNAALRMVVLVDRLYDRDIPVIVSGAPVSVLFSDEMLRGGYRKKYFRAVSRLTALVREGQGLSDDASAR